MPDKRIVVGQPVSRTMVERSIELRHTMTPAEQKLWQRLRAGRLEGFHFRRQQIIGRYIVDFFCSQADLVIEVDGGIHLDQVEYDQERDHQLEERGLNILRFTNTEIDQQLDKVLSTILEACHARRQ